MEHIGNEFVCVGVRNNSGARTASRKRLHGDLHCLLCLLNSERAKICVGVTIHMHNIAGLSAVLGVPLIRGNNNLDLPSSSFIDLR